MCVYADVQHILGTPGLPRCYMHVHGACGMMSNASAGCKHAAFMHAALMGVLAWCLLVGGLLAHHQQQRHHTEHTAQRRGEGDAGGGQGLLDALIQEVQDGCKTGIRCKAASDFRQREHSLQPMAGPRGLAYMVYYHITWHQHASPVDIENAWISVLPWHKRMHSRTTVRM